MADVVPKAVRSRIMSRIRGKGNKGTEQVFLSLLRANGIKGWRRHLLIRLASSRDVKALHTMKSMRLRPWVRPDFVFPKQRLAVFVDGCFWHGCPRHGTQPKQNRKFWETKIARNKARDREVTRVLRRKGWQVVRIWEHELTKPERVLARFSRWFRV